MPLLSVQGPRSREILKGLADADLSLLRYFSTWPEQVKLGGIPCWVMRAGFSGELGYELAADPSVAVHLWNAIQGAGVRIFGTHAVEMARVGSGMVVFGSDYQAGEGTPYDVGFDRLVALGDGIVDVTVAELSVYDPKKERPRS